MKKIVLVLVFLQIFCGSSVCAAAVQEFVNEVAFKNATGNPQHFIDFETYGNGTTVDGSPTINGNEWSNLGIEFAALESGYNLLLFEPPTEPEYISPTHTCMTSGDHSSYIITFSTPVKYFGMYIVDSEITSPNEKIILKDINDNIIDEFPMPVNPYGTNPPISKEFRGYVSDTPIAEVLIIEDADGEGMSLDNIMYSVAEPAGPVAYWSFDDAGDPGYDDSGNGNDGTVNGAISIDGMCGKALYFDGSGDYVDVPDSPGLNPTDVITITAWFKAESFALGSYAWPPLVTKYTAEGGYNLSVQKIYEGTPQITTSIFLEDLGPGGHITIQESLPTEVVLPNIWYFTAMTYDGSEFTLYRAKEGDAAPSLNASKSGSGSLAISTSNLRIGRDTANPGRYWKGLIDEVRIYDRALSESEIEELYTTCPESDWSFVHMTDPHFGYFPVDPKLSPFLAIYKLRKMDPRPDFALVTGDVANFGCNAFSGCNILTSPYNWYLAMVKYAGMGDEGIDVYSVPGNHDRRKYPGWIECFCDGELTCYNTYVNPLRPGGTTELDGSNNYYFEHKGLAFIGLDSGKGFPDGEGLWGSQIDALLNLNSFIPKVVFMHHPAVDVDDGPLDKDVSIGQNKPEFLDWCDSSNVELVLAGHSHQDHIYDKNGNDTLPSSEERPLFIQTPSAGKQFPELDLFQDDEGYRIVDVQNGKTYPKDYTRITTIEDDIYRIVAMLFSPANLHVYDSNGRHLGILDSGDTEWGIPDSVYVNHYLVPTQDGNETSPETIIIFDPCDEYLYEVVGSEIGTYRLEITLTEDGNDVVFEANGIPTLPGAIHDYIIDWEALSQGEDGVTIMVDSDGDGDFEKIIVSNAELTVEEFNIDPVANAGPDQVVECACNTGVGTQVTLDGTDSNDADGNSLTYTWTGPFAESPANGATPTVTLLDGCAGDYVITLVVNDGIEDSEPDEVLITVVDTTPPEFSLAVEPNVLWPPDHKMVEVTPSWTVSDDCDESPEVSLISITMNEGDETNTYDPTVDDTVGDGHTINDIQVNSDVSIYLRAERSGKGNGRVYTLTYEVVDNSGNATVESTTVTVPHDNN